MKSSDDGAQLTIGDVAHRFGLATHVLRHWEAMGLLTPAARVNGRRKYTDDHFTRIVMILRGKAAGLSLDQMRDLFNAPTRDEQRELLRHHHAELDERLRQIQESKEMIEHAIDCNADDFTQCLDFRRIVATVTPTAR